MKSDIYFIHLFNDYSGSPRVLRDAVDACENIKEKKYIFTSSHSGFLDNADCDYIRFFYRRSQNRYVQLFYYLVSQIHLFFLLSKYIFRSRCAGQKSTVVVNTLLPFGAGIAGKFFASKVVFYIHESYISPPLLKKLLRVVVDNCADHIVFVSHYLLRDEKFKKPQQQVIYNGLRDDFSSKILFSPNQKFKKKQVIFAGSLKLYKGIEQLALIAKALPDFNFIAAINCEKEELNDFLRDHLCQFNINWVARPDNLENLYAESFAVLNLSLPDLVVETFGLSLLEGMTLGCPAVAPPIGGPIEFVDKSCGLLVDSRETDQITSFLTLLASDFTLWKKYSQNAQKSASRFSSDTYRMAVRQYAKQHKLF